jgi:hypothetical protein
VQSVSDWLRAGRSRGRSSSSGRGRISLLFTSSRPHPASNPVGTGGKAAGHEADHSPQTSAVVKNTWIYTSTPPYAFMA